MAVTPAAAATETPAAIAATAARPPPGRHSGWPGGGTPVCRHDPKKLDLSARIST